MNSAWSQAQQSVAGLSNAGAGTNSLQRRHAYAASSAALPGCSPMYAMACAWHYAVRGSRLPLQGRGR